MPLLAAFVTIIAVGLISTADFRTGNFSCFSLREARNDDDDNNDNDDNKKTHLTYNLAMCAVVCVVCVCSASVVHLVGFLRVQLAGSLAKTGCGLRTADCNDSLSAVSAFVSFIVGFWSTACPDHVVGSH